MRARWLVVVSLALVLGLIAGCKDKKVKKRSSSPQASADGKQSPTGSDEIVEAAEPGAEPRAIDETDLGPGDLEVSSDPAEVDAARKAWQASREKALKALYADPRTIRPFDEESMELIQSQKDRSVKALTRMRDASKVTERRIAATSALKALGVEPDPAKLAALAENPDATAYLLGELRHLYKPAAGLPPPLRQLVMKSAESEDYTVLALAGDLIARFHLTEAADLVTEKARAARRGDTGFLRAAAVLRPSADVLDILEANMGYDSDRYFAMSVISELAKATRDADLRKRAAGTARDFLKQLPANPFMDEASVSAVQTITTAVPKDDAVVMLVDVVRAAAHMPSRVACLGQLKKLDPGKAARLSEETEITLPEPELAAVTLTAKEAAAVCVKHKLLTQAEADAALKAVVKPAAAGPSITLPAGIAMETRRGFDGDPDEEGQEPVPADEARGFLHAAKRFAMFDVETGDSPNRHDRLILKLAAASGGKFKPELATEEYGMTDEDDENGKYVVKFVHGGMLYKFQPKDLEDWYDLHAVLTAVNRALIDAGVAERFVPLEPEGQVAELVFGAPAGVKAASKELGVTVSKDPDAARKKGVGAQDKVLEQLRDFEGF